MTTRHLGMWVAVAAGLVSSTAAADEGATLRYKLARGDKLIYRSKMEMKQNQTIMGMTQDNEMDMESIQSFTVDGIDEKGNYQVSIKGERIKVKANFGFLGEFVFDSQSSERDKSSVIGAAVTPLMERLSGSVYHAVVSPDGGVIEVKGYADLIRDIVEGNPVSAQFAGGATDEAAKESLREIFPRLAKAAVKPGDTWDVPYEISMGKIGAMKGKGAYRYVGPDKVADRPTAKLDVSGETSLTFDFEMDGAKVTGTLGTTATSGTIQFDTATGRVLSSQGAVSIAGTLNVNAGGMDIPIQNEQNMKTKIEYLDKLPD